MPRKKQTAAQKRAQKKFSGKNMEDATFKRKFKGRGPTALDLLRKAQSGKG